MNKVMFLLTAFALALSTAAYAVTPAVGEEAPDFNSTNWILNAPESDTISDLRGSVVLVEHWGTRCPPCVAFISHLVKLQKEYGDKGLHIFTFEAQNSSEETIRSLMESKDCNYPVSKGTSGSYRGKGTIPQAWLIGPDGKVLWEGNPGSGNLDKQIKEQLENISFPGLGLIEVHKDLEKAAQAFVDGEFGDAFKKAEKAKSKAKEDEADLVEQAEFIVKRVYDKLSEEEAMVHKLIEAGEFKEAKSKAKGIKKAFKGTKNEELESHLETLIEEVEEAEEAAEKDANFSMGNVDLELFPVQKAECEGGVCGEGSKDCGGCDGECKGKDCGSCDEKSGDCKDRKDCDSDCKSGCDSKRKGECGSDCKEECGSECDEKDCGSCDEKSSDCKDSKECEKEVSHQTTELRLIGFSGQVFGGCGGCKDGCGSESKDECESECEEKDCGEKSGKCDSDCEEDCGSECEEKDCGSCDEEGDEKVADAA